MAIIVAIVVSVVVRNKPLLFRNVQIIELLLDFNRVENGHTYSTLDVDEY